jgi:hypothetical protein
MRWAPTISLIVILYSIGLTAWADTGAEIEHLLGYIASSSCHFVRNGEEYDAAAARAHIAGKYDYAKRWIRTAEQFIEYTAAKSSTSGRPYRVICPEGEEPSADWLMRELIRFRMDSRSRDGKG